MFSEIVNQIVSDSQKVIAKNLNDEKLDLDYVAIFSQSESEFDNLMSKIKHLGTVAEDTKTGQTFLLKTPISTPVGPLSLIKIRIPDSTRTQRGDTDFRSDFNLLKNKYQNLPNFKLIDRGEYQMLELIDPVFNVRVYFSSVPLSSDIFPSS